MKQVIRTIIAYYNGHEFIKEQVDSILNQEGIEAFDNQVYIYDDGSKFESWNAVKEMYKDVKNVRFFSDKSNVGPFERYLVPWATTLQENVDYLFLADQDDIFEKFKYSMHINAHIEKKKAMVVSSDTRWDYKTDTKKIRNRNCLGHNFSFDVKAINERYKFDKNKFINEVRNYKGRFITFLYHDSLLYAWFIATDDAFGLWGKSTCLHRMHSNSVTNSGTRDGKPWRVWRDSYNRYFLGYKPFFKNTLNINLTINMFNKRWFFADVNATENQAIAGWIKWKLDNFAMHIRVKFLRNSVGFFSDSKDASKHDRKISKKPYKQLIRNEKMLNKGIKKDGVVNE